MVLNGSDVTLICSVQMDQNVLTSELPFLMVNARLTRPDGSVFDLSDPVMSGTTYNFTTQVNSFGDSDVGDYTCTASVRLQASSPFLTGMGELVSNPINLAIINAFGK